MSLALALTPLALLTSLGESRQCDRKAAHWFQLLSMPLPAGINTVYRLFIIELYAVDNDKSSVQCVVVFCVKDGYNKLSLLYCTVDVSQAASFSYSFTCYHDNYFIL